MPIFGDVFPHSEYQIHRSQTTADATATTVYSISMAEEISMYCYVRGVCRKSDGSENGSFETRIACFRNSSSNITELGDGQHDIWTNYTAGFAADVTLVVNTTTQSLDIKVTGEASTSIYWDLRIGWNKISF